jgi:hypothetical protein
MARGIYKIELKHPYFPALSAAEAVEMRNNCVGSSFIQDEEVEVKKVVLEEHTVQLFLLTKTMLDMEKFTAPEIDAVICALAKELGYEDATAVADCVIRWTERITDDMTLSELEEWLIG